MPLGEKYPSTVEELLRTTAPPLTAREGGLSDGGLALEEPADGSSAEAGGDSGKAATVRLKRATS